MSAAGVRLFAAPCRLFRRDVTGRSENRQCPREIARGVEPFGQTEIAHQRFAAAVEQNVSGLQVAMQDSLHMRVLHGARDLGHQRDDPTRIFAKGSRRILQTSAGGKLHAEERQAVVALADFVDRQDVWMIQARGGFRFTSEPNECLLRIGLVTEDTFERHDAVRIVAGARDK